MAALDAVYGRFLRELARDPAGKVPHAERRGEDARREVWLAGSPLIGWLTVFACPPQLHPTHDR